MKSNEHKDLEENKSHIQKIEGVGRSNEVNERRNATPVSTNPSTSHIIDVNVIGQRTSEKQKQPEVDQDCQYMANRLSRFVSNSHPIHFY